MSPPLGLAGGTRQLVSLPRATTTEPPVHEIGLESVIRLSGALRLRLD